MDQPLSSMSAIALRKVLSSNVDFPSINPDIKAKLQTRLIWRGMPKDGQVWITTYKPFGDEILPEGGQLSDLKTARLFTGQRKDLLSGLYNYGARLYDPLLGRWVQPDTIVPLESQGVQAWDRFAFCNNNPLKYTDPSGHNPFLVAAILIIGAIMLTKDSPIAPPPTYFGNAENVEDLVHLGIEQANHANITGEGLQSLQSDPSVQAAQGRIVDQIRSEPGYGEQPFSLNGDFGRTSFTANGDSGNWRQAAVEGNDQAHRPGANLHRLAGV